MNRPVLQPKPAAETLDRRSGPNPRRRARTSASARPRALAPPPGARMSTPPSDAPTAGTTSASTVAEREPAAGETARSREERRRARNRRGFRARPVGRGTPPALDPMPPPPLVEQAQPRPTPTGDEVADLLLDRWSDPAADEPPPANAVFGRPAWHWGALLGVSGAVGGMVAWLTGDGPLVLSSAAATAMGVGAFMALFQPPTPAGPPGAVAPPPTPAPTTLAAEPPPTAPPPANRASRRALGGGPPAASAGSASRAARGPRPRGPKDVR